MLSGRTPSYAELGNNKNQNLFQAVQVSQSLPGYTATAGPVFFNFDYKSNNIITGSTFAKLYGSDTQPTYTSLGTMLGNLTGFASTQITWENKSLSFVADSGYAWYTLVITGNTDNPKGNFQVDNVNVQVTPIPATAWLLGTGLIGLVVIRRRMKK